MRGLRKSPSGRWRLIKSDSGESHGAESAIGQGSGLAEISRGEKGSSLAHVDADAVRRSL